MLQPTLVERCGMAEEVVMTRATRGLLHFVVFTVALLSQPSLPRAARVTQGSNFSTEVDIQGCCEVIATTETVVDWVLLAAEQNLDRCCENYGSAFGEWATKACPDSLSDVAASIRQAAEEAGAGKSGAKVIVTPLYVVKTLNEDEYGQTEKLLQRLKLRRLDDRMGIQRRTASFLVPTCRAIKVTSPEGSDTYLQIMPNIMLQTRFQDAPQLTFDLKGNWDYGAREADDGARVLKDKDFFRIFPEGVDLYNYRSASNAINSPALEAAGLPFVDAIKSDTALLLDKKLLDYSILLSMYVIGPCSPRVVVKSLHTFTAFHEGKAMFLSPFSQTGLTHDGRPVYVNRHGEYLSYWKEWGEWAVGFDYKTSGRGVAGKSDGQCPNEVEKWYAHVGQRFEEKGQIKGWSSQEIIQFQEENAPSEYEEDIIRKNPNSPLIWVRANGINYIAALGIIDMLMNEHDRGFWNVFGSGVTLSDCTPGDIDPIPAREYRVRFLRMLGYKDPSFTDGTYCGSCLGSRRRQSYTYISTEYQRQRYRTGACAWGK